jgi:hypothetical protein
MGGGREKHFAGQAQIGDRWQQRRRRQTRISLGDRLDDPPGRDDAAGVSGNKAENMIARFAKDMLARKPTIVTISVGTFSSHSFCCMGRVCSPVVLPAMAKWFQRDTISPHPVPPGRNRNG